MNSDFLKYAIGMQWLFLDNYPLGGAAAIEVILFPFMPAVSVSVPPFSLDTTVGL